MSESALMIVLRLIHIICGVFWAGTVMSFAWFVLPAQKALGPPGMTFIQELMVRQRLRAFVIGAMMLTILSGLTMYIRTAVMTHGQWTSSTNGIVLGIGGVAAIFAGGIGGGVVGSIGKKMMALGGQIQAAGGTPTEAQRGAMEVLQSRGVLAFRVTAVLVLIAVSAMASARYL